MDPQSIRKYLLPAAGLALVIVGVGVVIGLMNAAPGGSSAGGGDPSKPLIPPGADVTATGMSDTMPPPEVEPWTVLPGGLKYRDVVEGQGETVSAGQLVAMHYHGWLAPNGFCFDSSVKKGEPLQRSLNELITGWQNGVPGMKVGGIRRLYVPWRMGYGEQGSGNIPPRCDLVFEIKLLAFL